MRFKIDTNTKPTNKTTLYVTKQSLFTLFYYILSLYVTLIIRYVLMLIHIISIVRGMLDDNLFIISMMMMKLHS